MKSLIVIESASKIPSLKKYISQNPDAFFKELGISSNDQVEIKATYGHMVKANITNGAKGFSIKDGKYELNTIRIPDKINNINELIAQLKMSDQVFVMTDNDNQGELIGYEVYHLLRKDEWANKKFYRVRTVAIKPQEFLNGLRRKQPNLDIGMVNAALGQQLYDLEYGLSLTILVREEMKDYPNHVAPDKKQAYINFIQAHHDNIINSASGRLKSFILNAIGSRASEVRNYQETTWYTLNPIVNELKFDHTQTAFPNTEIKNNNVIFKSYDDAKNALNTWDNTFVCKNISDVVLSSGNRYKPLTLSDVPANNLSNGSKTKIDVCQVLYEAGKITYHRTDVELISPDFIQEDFGKWQKYCANKPEWQGQIYAELPPKEFIIDPTKSSDNAHECLRVTDLDTLNVEMLNDVFGEKKEYEKVLAYVNLNKAQVDEAKDLNHLIQANQDTSIKNQLLLFNDYVKVYHFILNGTRKVFTNASQYLKSEIDLFAKNSPSDVFSKKLNQLVVIGYNGIDNTEIDETLNNTKNLKEICAKFKVNETYQASNFAITDINVPNSIITKRVSIKPKLYNNNTLIAYLKKSNVGTPATRDQTIAIMETSKKGIIKFETEHNIKYYDLSQMGNFQYNITKKYCPLDVTPEFTKKLDEDLELIKNNKYTINELMDALMVRMNDAPFKQYNWYYWKNENAKIIDYTATTNLPCYKCGQNMVLAKTYLYCVNESCDLVLQLINKWNTDATFKLKYPNKPKKAYIIPSSEVQIDGPLCPTHHTAKLSNQILNIECLADYFNGVDCDYLCYYCNSKTRIVQNIIKCTNLDCESKKDHYNLAYLKSLNLQKICPTHHFPYVYNKEHTKDYCLYDLKHSSITPWVVKNDIPCVFCNEPMSENDNWLKCTNEKCPSCKYTGDKKPFSIYKKAAVSPITYCEIHPKYMKLLSKNNKVYCVADLIESKIKQEAFAKLKPKKIAINAKIDNAINFDLD